MWIAELVRAWFVSGLWMDECVCECVGEWLDSALY